MPPAPDKLARIEKEFARIGLLLQHDRELTSFTTLVAGKPVAGSWWGHRRGREIYRLLEEFHLRSGKLSAKLVNGKVTYVHPRLWNAFLELVSHGQRTRARRLSPRGKALYKMVLGDAIVRVDELAKTGFAAARELAAAARELEEGILVYADSVHTASGAHAKILQSWSGWARDHDVARPATYTLGRARLDLTDALHRLQEGSTHPIALPLPVERRR